MLQSLDASLRRAGYQTLVSFYRPDHGIEREKLQFLSRAGIDALAYTPENITAGEFQDIFSAGSMPVVLIDRMIAGIQTADAVLVDSAAAVQAAVDECTAELGDSGRVLLRKSGTEPVLRVMAEAGTAEECEKQVDRIIAAMEKSGHLIEVKK